jgi:hypothetical protein
MKNRFGWRMRVLFAVLVSGLACVSASGALTVIGTQYQPDQMFTEFDCYWNGGNYPNPCPTNHPGATFHVYVKNTGNSSATITDATLTANNYSLETAIKMNSSIANLSSIYFYWNDPPQAILDAGEPVWWKADPPTVPVGGVAQVAVRLRYYPTVPTVAVGVVSSAGTVTTNITVDSLSPRVSSIGYSGDRKKIYLHWRRTSGGGSSGAAPAAVWLDGTDVTAYTQTVGDTNVDFAASVISLPSALGHFSYHVYQGVYADGKIAAASQRAWTNKFIYATYGTFDFTGSYDGPEWVAEASDHGFNNVQMNLGGMGSYMGTSAGRADMLAHGYGYTIMDPGKLNPIDPDMWFLNDEPDITEWNQAGSHCNTGLNIPCDYRKYPGTLVMDELEHAATLRAVRPNVPTTVNLDSAGQPWTYYDWGPAVDILQSDTYYEPRMKGAYTVNLNRIPLYNDAKLSYAVGRTMCAGAEPNPSNHLLYSTQQTDWPYPDHRSKRMEVYYTLAGGTKGIGYWWLIGANGMNNTDPDSRLLWKEIGLCGNEIKTARDLIVRSTPVNLAINPNSSLVWARAVASSIDSLILYVVNDNYASDINGCHVTNVANVVITNTLPSWLVSGSTTAFEISTGGKPVDVTHALNGDKLTVSLGTLSLTRMIIITTDAGLKAALEARFVSQVRPGLCAFASELCQNNPPGFSQQPFNQRVPEGGTANFSVVANGSGTLFYRWQKNTVDLNNGGHYAGAMTSTLTITGANTNDVASYRCLVTNSFGSATSSNATLTLGVAPTNSCVGIVNADAEGGFTLMGGGYIANGWTEFEGAYGTNVIGYDETATTNVHGGAHSQRIRVWGEGGTSGGCLQRVAANVGADYAVSVWMKAFDTSSSCFLGVDPAGGTDANDAGVLWSPAHSDVTWIQRTVNVTAAADYFTVFYKVASSNGAKRNGYFDDALPTECVNMPPGITQPPTNQTVFAGGTASFAVGANGTEPLSFRWQKNSTNVNDGGHYSGSTTPTLTISEADNSDVASYRCVVTNAWGGTNSSAVTLTVSVGAGTCLLAANSDFESGFTLAGGGYIGNNWTEWEDLASGVIGYDDTSIVYSGAHSQRIRVSGGTTGTSGGVYQRIPVTAGQIYKVSSWAYAGDSLTTCSLGVDPVGGTNANSGVTWTSGTTEAAWVLKAWTGTASANYLTVFYKVASTDNVKRNGYFDGGSSGPLQLSVQRNGDALTLAWPECPGARLEWVGDLQTPGWTTATNQVNTSEGQKITTLTPTGSAGYFRLVLE